MRNGSFRFDVSICEMSKDPTTESAQVVKADADVMLQEMDVSGVAG